MNPRHGVVAFILLLAVSGWTAPDPSLPVPSPAETQVLIDKEVIRIDASLGSFEAGEKLIARGLRQIGSLKTYSEKKRLMKLALRIKDRGVVQARDVYFDRDLAVIHLVAATRQPHRADVHERYSLHKGKLVSWQQKRTTPLQPSTPERQARADELWREIQWYIEKAAAAGHIIDIDSNKAELELE